MNILAIFQVKIAQILVGSCAFLSVRTWNVLFVEFSGVELSFPSFLSAPPQAQTSTTTPPTFLQIFDINGSHQGLSLLSLNTYLLSVAHIRYRCCRCSLRSKPHANRLEVGFFACHFHISFSTYHFRILLSIYSGKAPRKQLATKAARKTAQVCAVVAVVAAIDNISLNFFLSFLFTFRPLLEESRSPIDSVPVPSLSVRSGVTKNPLSSSSESFHSRGLSVKLLRTSRLLIIYHTYDSY